MTNDRDEVDDFAAGRRPGGKYEALCNYLEISERTGAQRIYRLYNGQKMVLQGGSADDPYWDVPRRAIDVDEPIYEQISREMIHDDAWGSGTPLEEFIAELRAIAGKGKKGCPVFVKYDRESDYEGGYYYYFQVGYERPPTKAERKQRQKINRLVAERDAELAKKAAEDERKAFERLKAKYEGGTTVPTDPLAANVKNG